MNTQLATDCNALNWIAQNARYFFNEGSLGNYHQWIFKGYLPEKMVKEIRGFVVTQESHWETGICNYLLRIEGFEFQMRLPFGDKKFETIIDITKGA